MEAILTHFLAEPAVGCAAARFFPLSTQVCCRGEYVQPTFEAPRRSAQQPPASHDVRIAPSSGISGLPEVGQRELAWMPDRRSNSRGERTSNVRPGLGGEWSRPPHPVRNTQQGGFSADPLGVVGREELPQAHRGTWFGVVILQHHGHQLAERGRVAFLSLASAVLTLGQ